MSLSKSACAVQPIEEYLGDTISSVQEKLLLDHLEQCEHCRSRLEEAAAERATWDSASKFLPDDPHDHLQLSGLIDLDAGQDAFEQATSQTVEITNVLGILSPTDDPQKLGRLGPYEVSGVVGAGGMGVVLKGHDGALDRVVAIKVLAPHLATSNAARKRFAREAKAAAAVLHPNIMPIHGVRNGGALPYFVMPYMRGASLQKRIDENGTLSTVEILRVASQIAAGLAAAHAQGLVHRDIKPANIMLAEGLERVAITDFGLARAADDATMTRSGVIAGTPQYMSPEQARGEPIDARSDLFSLGSLIYAMCVGHSPFRAESSFGVLRRITDDSPRDLRQLNAEIPPWLCCLVEQLHQKSPADRIQSAREAEQLLTQCLAHLEQPQSCQLPRCLLQSNASNRLNQHRIRSPLPLPSKTLFLGAVATLLVLSCWLAYGNGWRKTSDKQDSNAADRNTAEGPVLSSPVDEAPSVAPTPQPSDPEPLWQDLDQDFQQLTNELIPDINAIEQSIESTKLTEENGAQ